MIMKRLIGVLVPVLIVAGGVYATGGPAPPDPVPGTIINVGNDISTNQSQSQSQAQTVSVDSGNATSTSEGGDASASARGGSAKSDSLSGASISTVSNFETRTPPLSVFPPYLPYWNHGGWGTIKAYFPNGPNLDNQVYEQTFDPDNPDDVRMLKGVLKSIAHEGPLEVVGGLLNGVGVVFGGPDNFHHGRGFEIANSLCRDRRPDGKPLLVFIDSNVDTVILQQAGYAYIGKVSLEGKVERSWDQVYDAAVAETLPWDVDLLLISGGMRGVTVGSNLSFPGAAAGYSQPNYSISLFGAYSSGITEGKGRAIVSAAGYRFWPDAVKKRKIPQSFYNRIHASCQAASHIRQGGIEPVKHVQSPQPRQPIPPAETVLTPGQRTDCWGVEVSSELMSMAGF
jgi:hypothetical protein